MLNILSLLLAVGHRCTSCLNPPKDKKGVELLRAMEPPRHDDFEPDRLPSREEQKQAKKALKDIAVFVREMLKRRAKDPVSEVTKIDELKEFFADDSDPASGNGTEEINPYGKIVITAKPLAIKKANSIPAGTGNAGDGDSDMDGSGGGGDDGDGGGDGDGGAGTGPNGAGSGLTKPVAGIANLRSVIINRHARRLSFTPQTDGLIALTLFEVGADSDYSIAVVSASTGHIANGKLLVAAQKGIRQSIDVDLIENFEGAMKVVAHEV